MKLRRFLLAALLALSAVPAFGQAPPPVPGLPDTERRTTYSISASTCSCAVNFALYGDSTDFGNWLEVFVNGVLQSSSTYTITSPTGPLATIARPITDAVLTFNAAQTGTVQIVGARRPRRVSQFSENRGVAARDLNQTVTDIVAMLREDWDKINDVTGRAVLAAPGETLALLPAKATRQNQGACFDANGNLVNCVSIPSSTFAAGNGITFSGVNPTTITNNISAGSGISLSGTNPIVISTTGGTSSSVVSFGAVDDCVTDNTTAFQNAINAAVASGGPGMVFVPPVRSGGCFLVGAINATGKSNVTIFGNGDQSLIEVHGSSATNKIWWDATGSSNIRFLNLKIAYDGTTIPKILFLIAAQSGVTGDIVRGIRFDHVNIDAQATEALAYVYAVAYNNNSTYTGGAGGLTCENSVWFQRKNGGSVSSANDSLKTAVISFDGINSRSIASDYVTISAAHGGSQSINLTNCNFIDYPAGVGAGTKDSNTGMVLVTVGQFVMTNGSVQCFTFACIPIWTNTEAVRFDSVVLKNSDGGGGASATTNYYFMFGGGINGFVTLDNVFFSDLPSAAGAAAYIGFDNTATQVAFLNVFGPDIGANSFSNKFISTNGGCGGHTASTFQLYQSFISLWDTNNAIQICDSIDKNTTIRNSGTITLASAGATDASFQPGGPARTFGTLPTCNAANQGAIRLVGDSATSTFNATVTGGAGNVVYAMCNATNWVAH